MRNLILMGCLVFLAACTPKLSGNVESFSSDDFVIDTRPVFIKAYPDELNNSLEYKAYKKSLKTYLRDEGFQLTEEETEADLVAFFNFGIDNGVIIDPEDRDGSSRVSVGGGYGSGMRGSFLGVMFRMPVYSSHNAKQPPYTQYTRYIQLEIVEAASILSDTDSPVKIYEGRVESKGRCGVLSSVMDEMLELLFEKFPNGSGKISTELKGEC